MTPVHRGAARALAAGLPLAALLLAAGCGTLSTPAPLPTVAQVDLARYAGTWHEIARLPNVFQNRCTGEVTATYARRADGAVSVTNRCRTADGGFTVAEGVARTLDASNARLKVSFLPAALRWLPFGEGDYQVIALDADYGWVMIGEPGRGYLWVLARQPSLPPATLQALLERARTLGFPVERVIRTGTAAAPR
jgi:apolipoprotein D and lipocalin family protein